MNITECRKVVSDNLSLIGKKVKYKEEILTVIDIFPCPSEENQIVIFLKHYNEFDKENAINRFLPSKNFEVALYCNNDQMLFLNEVEIL